MSLINDKIKKITELGGNDGLVYWFSRTTGESINDAESRFLKQNDSISGGCIQDMWLKMLSLAGYSGTVNDMLSSYWLAPKVFSLANGDIVPAIGTTGTFTRTTVKTYDDNDNIIQSASSGEIVHTDKGFLLEPQRTNKCTNYSANPNSSAFSPTSASTFNTNTTNLTAFDAGTGALFGVVDDTTELTNAGLNIICSSGLVYKIDNSSGSGAAVVTVTGSTGNINKHTMSCYVRVDSGDSAQITFNGVVPTASTTSTTYVRLVDDDITPSDTTKKLQMYVGAGSVGYFILNQLEEAVNETSVIVVEGSSFTRNADNLEYPSTYLPSTDYVFSFDWTPSAENQGTMYLISSYLDASNSISIWHNGTNVFVNKRVSGVAYNASKSLSYTSGTTYNIKGRYDSVNGVDVWVDGVKGTNNSNTSDSVLGTTIEIGFQGAGNNQIGWIDDFTIYKGIFTDSEVTSL